ncbi:toxin-activating lysine-acyltransferase [Photobacterium kishitanii]|nr:toxin-activating lysine-acyltransferase [Photobacterium kishitanii]PSV07926.1 toxin-activating lysine-acyltransferase [Photobacterium kishitanii]PSV09446.1 toxin-activating lysine-acyltransferase [Photobacterium kishitanii]PSV72904.1 toxin-activating lysine-acyltransferase [Photobacterium kishitanii]PSW47870.1 toxin-activating lysine-acyltransferase [Photobacterium kishitanii]
MTRVVLNLRMEAFMMILDKSNISVSTKNSLFMERDQCGKNKSEILQEIGQLLEVTVKDSVHKTVNINSFLYWIKPAILHNQYILIDSKGSIEPIGYLIWAWVDNKTLLGYLNNDHFILHPMCWNEGNNLIIVDFLCTEKPYTLSVIKKLYRNARYKAFISCRDINICIRDKSGLVIKHNRK